MLHVNHDYNSHLWCGIGSLSAAAGIPTSEAEALIQDLGMRSHIKAVTYSEMADALTACGELVGQNFFPREADDCPTLKQWWDHLAPEYKEGLDQRTFVICITGHWLVVRHGKWVCSMNHAARAMDDCPYLGSRVRHIITFDNNKHKPQTVSGS